MASTSLQNISANSWTALSKDERKKFILQIQEANNQTKLNIDDRQKTLAELRKTVPEECREMFEEEKKILLKHYITAELMPQLLKKGMSVDEKQRMITNINRTVEAQVVHQEETKLVNERTKQLRAENEYLRSKLKDMADKMLKELQE